jgi:CysZ protein
MGTALLRAILTLSAPTLRRVVALGLGLSALAFVLIWTAAAALLAHTALFAWRPLDWLVELSGGLAVLVLSWLLFPAVATLVMSCFLDRVATAVEASDYPDKGAARSQPWRETAVAAARLGAAAIACNLLASPLYLLAPGINSVLFLVLNGYLFGRGYFEVVALRRLDIAAAKLLRRRFAGRIFIGGVAITGLFTLPIVNLVAPVIATAFMVHVFHGLPRRAVAGKISGIVLSTTLFERVSEPCSAASEAKQRTAKWQKQPTIWAYR